MNSLRLLLLASTLLASAVHAKVDPVFQGCKGNNQWIQGFRPPSPSQLRFTSWSPAEISPVDCALACDGVVGNYFYLGPSPSGSSASISCYCLPSSDSNIQANLALTNLNDDECRQIRCNGNDGRCGGFDSTFGGRFGAFLIENYWPADPSPPISSAALSAMRQSNPINQPSNNAGSGSSGSPGAPPIPAVPGGSGSSNLEIGQNPNPGSTTAAATAIAIAGPGASPSPLPLPSSQPSGPLIPGSTTPSGNGSPSSPSSSGPSNSGDGSNSNGNTGFNPTGGPLNSPTTSANNQQRQTPIAAFVSAGVGVALVLAIGGYIYQRRRASQVGPADTTEAGSMPPPPLAFIPTLKRRKESDEESAEFDSGNSEMNTMFRTQTIPPPLATALLQTPPPALQPQSSIASIPPLTVLRISTPSSMHSSTSSTPSLTESEVELLNTYNLHFSSSKEAPVSPSFSPTASDRSSAGLSLSTAFKAHQQKERREKGGSEPSFWTGSTPRTSGSTRSGSGSGSGVGGRSSTPVSLNSDFEPEADEGVKPRVPVSPVSEEGSVIVYSDVGSVESVDWRRSGSTGTRASRGSEKLVGVKEEEHEDGEWIEGADGGRWRRL
ncbi:hypothetical protein HDV05_002862 [Chytridiales sp. JEL 0842]|nr:hypothetical protein HDV05_002862 [Chytridiales sp. JEL 0842]